MEYTDWASAVPAPVNQFVEIFFAVQATMHCSNSAALDTLYAI